MHLLHGKKFFTVFRKDQSFVHLLSTTFCVTYFFLHGVTATSYADETTSYIAQKTNDLVVRKIEQFSNMLFQWFIDFNFMKINSEKSYILI